VEAIKTKDEIAALPEDELIEYFEDQARYDPRNRKTPYSIRFGDQPFISDDTADLAKRFYAAVKRYRGSLYGKTGAFSRG
jgi:hypothetical protein